MQNDYTFVLVNGAEITLSAATLLAAEAEAYKLDEVKKHGLNSVVKWYALDASRETGEALPLTSAAGFYRTTSDNARIWVTTDGRVRIHRATHTSNPHQPSHKWFQAARPANIEQYVAGKLRNGLWVAEGN